MLRGPKPAVLNSNQAERNANIADALFSAIAELLIRVIGATHSFDVQWIMSRVKIYGVCDLNPFVPRGFSLSTFVYHVFIAVCSVSIRHLWHFCGRVLANKLQILLFQSILHYGLVGYIKSG